MNCLNHMLHKFQSSFCLRTPVLIDVMVTSLVSRGILRWGKNVGSVKTRSARRAGVAVYNKASSLETLVSCSNLKLTSVIQICVLLTFVIVCSICLRLGICI